MRSSEYYKYFRQKLTLYEYFASACFYVILFIIMLRTYQQDACFQSVAFHDFRLYDNSLLNNATMHDAVLNALHNVAVNNNVLHDDEFHDAALYLMLHCNPIIT